MTRSAAYWAGNLYSDAGVEPERLAPVHDLPAAAAARFGAAREGLLALPGVVEEVRFMGPVWRWAWEYGIGPRKLCWLHPVRQGPGATFALNETEESELRGDARLAAAVRRAVEEGQRTGPVRWCGVELVDGRGVQALLALARRKAQWIAAGPPAAGRPARRSRRGSGQPRGDGVDPETE